MSNDIRQQVEALLDLEIRPALAAHDGNIMIQSIDEGTINVKLSGKMQYLPQCLNGYRQFYSGKDIKRVSSIPNGLCFNCVSEDLLQQARDMLRASKG